MNAYAPVAARAAFDARLGDAWRQSARKVDHNILFIRQHLRVIAERKDRLPTGTLVHSRRYVWQCRGELVRCLQNYREAVRTVTECEARMEAIGMPFAKSSDHWEN